MQTSIPIFHFPRQVYNMDRQWSTNMPIMHRNPLEHFDPYDQVDQVLSRTHLKWLQRPSEMSTTSTQRDVPHRYRITLNCVGVDPKTIKIELKETKSGQQQVLRVCGLEQAGNSQSSNDFMRHELKKSLTLPQNIEHNKMVSFLTSDGKLIIEFPMMKSDSMKKDVSPNDKELKLRLPLPRNISADKIHLLVKDRDLIMRVEEQQVMPDSITRIHIFDRVTLPDNVDWNSLKCLKEADQMVVTALTRTSTSLVKQPHEIQIETQRDEKRQQEDKNRKLMEDRMSRNLLEDNDWPELVEPDSPPTTPSMKSKKNKNNKF